MSYYIKGIKIPIDYSSFPKGLCGMIAYNKVHILHFTVGTNENQLFEHCNVVI